MKMTINAEPHEIAELLESLTAQRQPQPARPTVSAEQIDECVRNLVHGELSTFLGDVERRLSQTREIERSMVDAGLSVPGLTRQVHTEDLNIGKHLIDGYTLTSNSPAAGSIAWAGVHVVYNGVDYTAADGNTANMYVYFIKPASGTSVTLTSSNTKPTAAVLGVGGALLFKNNGGTPISVLESSIPSVIADGTVDTGAIISGAVGNAQLGSNAVDSDKLANGAVIAGKIGTGGVSAAAQFASGVVDTTALGGNAVTTAKIASNAVTSTELANNSVIAGKIATGGISLAAQFASGVVDTSALGTNAVTTAKLNAGTVTPVKFNTLNHMLY